MNRHKKSPVAPTTEDLGVKTFDGNHDMNSNTAVSNVIPFAFEAKSVRVQQIDGSPWFCLTDVCSILGYSNSRDAMAKHCRETGVAKRDISSTGQRRSLTFVSEGNLYRLIIKSRKDEAQRFESWVCDEVLPSIRKSGGYADRHAVMGDLVGAVIGSSGEVVLDRVIDQKIIGCSPSVQRSIRHTLKSRLRSRFNVQKTALIPVECLADACNFVAAYAIEGELLPRLPEQIKGLTLPTPLSPNQRLLVSMGRDGQIQVREVPHDACVMTIPELLDQLNEPNGVYTSQAELFDFAIKTMQHLRRRVVA